MDVVSDAISAMRVGRATSQRVRAGGRWCTRLARYDGAGFHVVLAGTCWLRVDGAAPVALGTGDAVLLPHGAGHVLADAAADRAAVRSAVPFEAWLDRVGPDEARTRPGDTELMCGKYRLDRSRLHPLMAELPAVVHLPHRVGDHPELRAVIDLMAGELDERRPGACLALPNLLDLLLVYLIRAWMADATTGAWPTVLGDTAVAAALRALHSDPSAAWTNDRLAAVAGVSRPTLARRFTTLVGRPPMAYLTWWRLTLAATRLRDTTDPLATIARHVGYGGPYALSHAFTREFGTTPGRYRTAPPTA